MLLVATVASHTGKNILSAAKWYILHLYLDNHQKSRLKIRIHTGEKITFQKGACLIFTCPKWNSV